MTTRPPIKPDRVRSIVQQSFAFIHHRFLRDGFLTSITHRQRSLYLFLVLAGDRYGVSFYPYDRICSLLGVTLEEYIEARNALMDRDLVAFDGTCFQVLSLPPTPIPGKSEPSRPPQPRRNGEPLALRRLILGALLAGDEGDDDAR